MAGVPADKYLVAMVERGSKKAFIYCPFIEDVQNLTNYHLQRDTTLTWYTARFSTEIQRVQLDNLSDMFSR